MSMFDSILSQVGSNVDVANMASKLGIDKETAEKAIAALGKAHGQEGDTVSTAAASTGLDSGILSQIVGHIGGEGSLGQFASLIEGNSAFSGILGSLDKDGDGNPLNDLGGMAKGLFS